MAKVGKWIGGGLGWALGGPIGGIIGFVMGSMFDNIQTQQKKLNPPTQRGDFNVSLLILTASVMRADGKVLKSELAYVKKFFLQQYSEEESEQQLIVLREVLKKDYNLTDVCRQIRMSMDYSSRLQLLHFLFGISRADGHLHEQEIVTVENIAGYMGIREPDLDSIRAMFIKDIDSAYKVLEISPHASDDEVKKAYREMAKKYHPDKVAHLGEEIKKAAGEKFRELNNAYEEIKRKRNIS